MKFLIIDSNKARLRDLQKNLMESKLDQAASVMQVGGLVQAFKVMETTEVDFIFMNGSGLKNFTDQVRQMRAVVGGTPIVALISRTQEASTEEILKAGANDCAGHCELSKNLLSRIIRSVMSGRLADQAKADFLNSVSHEMRTSLHWILGTVDLLNEAGLNPRQKKLVQTFSLASQRLLMLLGNVLGVKGADLVDRSLPEEAPPLTAAKEDLDILVVDDDLENQRLIAAFTEKTRHRITYAKDGYEALNLSKNRCFDIILMDIQMPGLNGFETARLMKDLQACRRSKIMGLSANAFPQDLLSAKKLGFAGYMTKPINRERLLSSIAGCYNSKTFYEPSKRKDLLN